MMRLLRDSTVQTLLFSLALIVLGGLARPAGEEHGLPESTFWASKLQWHNCAHIVVLGDSRAFRGLSPAAMRTEVRGLNIYNYAFSANGYTPEYLAQAEAVLYRASPMRIALLCISPRSLTPGALNSNGFLDLKRRNPVEIWFTAHGGNIVGLLAPYEFPDILAAMRGGRRKVAYTNIYRPDGFIGSTREPEDQTLQLADYEAIFRAGPASEQAVQDVLKYVKRWTGMRIHVYGLRPPVGAEMYNLEQRLSDFDALDFQRRFEEAGGVWIELDSQAYHTYDGSHLTASSAAQYSRDVALQMEADILQPRIEPWRKQ